MKDIVLTCCGAAMAPPPVELNCPECGTHWTGIQMEQVQMQEMERIPVVDVLRAARMLGQDRNWVQTRRAELGAIYYAATDLPDVVFPLIEIRRFAREHSLELTPLAIENGALWARRNP